MKEKKTNPVGPVIVVLVVSMLLGLIWSNSNRKNKTARVKVPVPAIEITKGEPKGLEIKVPFGPKDSTKDSGKSGSQKVNSPNPGADGKGAKDSGRNSGAGKQNGSAGKQNGGSENGSSDAHNGGGGNGGGYAGAGQSARRRSGNDEKGDASKKQNAQSNAVQVRVTKATFAKISGSIVANEDSASDEYKINTIVVPANAVLSSIGALVVFIVVDNVAKRREVLTGSEYENNIEILSGIKEGDIVVIAGQGLLSDNQPVRIVN